MVAANILSRNRPSHTLTHLAYFRSLFLDKEEDNVIQLSSLEDEAAAAQTPEQLHAVYKRFVNFHGELLLMVHWSILAYTGLVKILKKHHKRTGLLVRAPHLDNLLSQPFCSIEVSCAQAGYQHLIADGEHTAILSCNLLPDQTSPTWAILLPFQSMTCHQSLFC